MSAILSLNILINFIFMKRKKRVCFLACFLLLPWTPYKCSKQTFSSLIYRRADCPEFSIVTSALLRKIRDTNSQMGLVIVLKLAPVLWIVLTLSLGAPPPLFSE